MNSDFDQKNEMGLFEFIRQLFREMSTFFGSFFHYFKLYVRMLVAKAWIFLAIILFTVAIAFFVKTFFPRYYKTQAVWAVNNISPKLAQQAIINFNTLKKNVPYQQTLGISNAAAASIKEMEFNDQSGDDSLNSFFTFNIMMKITDTNYIDEVQNSIPNLFTRNKFIEKKFKEKTEELREQRKIYQSRLTQIDSLKKIVSQLASENNISPAFFYFNSISPSTLFDAEVSTNNELMKIDNELKNSPVEIVQPFFKPEKQNEPNVDLLFWKIILLGLPFALILTPAIGHKRTN